jgi:hypothetical protein
MTKKTVLLIGKFATPEVVAKVLGVSKTRLKELKELVAPPVPTTPKKRKR